MKAYMVEITTHAVVRAGRLDQIVGWHFCWVALLQENEMQFLAQIQGGIGPDVWDKEVFIDAADFLDAAQQVSAKADDIGGQVTLLEQCDCSEAEALDRAVNRFLTWPLPNTVSADHCERESDAQGRCAQRQR